MKKLGKRALLANRKLKAEENFNANLSYCINNGIWIYPECISDRARWRLVITFVNKDGNVTEIKKSDPKFYFSKEEYEIKHKELLAFYSKSP